MVCSYLVQGNYSIAINPIQKVLYHVEGSRRENERIKICR